MKISYNWLSEYLSKKIPPQEVASALTMSIAEVEGSEDHAQGLDKCVVGVITKIEAHPNADRLKLVDVNVGAKHLRVVCGGVNLYEGMKVAFAHVGARIKWHGGTWTTLEPAVIRGEKSEGMICASVELELEERFPATREREVIDLKEISSKPGTPLAQALGADDVVFTIDNKSLTHRADLFSHVGLAREAAAVTSATFKTPKFVKPKAGREKKLTVDIQEPTLCRRYMGAIIGVKVGPSPDWLRKRLETVGQRSINNVVDVTNEVMFELGQPLHVFDASKVSGNRIIVRRGRKEEVFTTLDGAKRTLDSDMLMIADAEKATAIAGIMGGENSEVTEATTEIILESANFEPINARQTSQKLGLRTEGLIRWEKGLTTPLSEQGFNRALELLTKVAEAQVLSNIVDNYPTKEKSVTITLRHAYLNEMIGVEIQNARVKTILADLGCAVRAAAGGWRVTPPIPRHDLVFEEDLVEEVARVYGYNNIPLTPLAGILELQEVDREKACERDAVRACVNLGFTEVYTNSFYGDAEIQKNSLTEKHVELENSQSEELKFLRASLLPGLLASVQKNVKQQNALRFVEGGHIFPTPASEYSAVAGVLTGERKQTFLVAKGVVERILEKLSIAPAFAASHDGVDILIHGKREGTIGHVSDPVRKAHHIPTDVAFFTLNVPALAKARGNARSFIPLPNFPSVFLDLAFEVHDSVAYEDLERTIRKSGEPLLASLELFDIYEGDQIAEHHRSLAFHLVYQALDRTLTLDEAQAQHELVINALQKTFNVTRRGEHKNS